MSGMFDKTDTNDNLISGLNDYHQQSHDQSCFYFEERESFPQTSDIQCLLCFNYTTFGKKAYIYDVSICPFCNKYPNSAQFYMVYTTFDGLVKCQASDIFNLNIDQVHAISCPHNQLKLRNFSKNYGQIIYEKLRTIKELDLIRLGTQKHIKIPDFKKLCTKPYGLRDEVIYFFQYELYGLLKTSKVCSQGQRRSAFFVNIMNYIEKLSNPDCKIDYHKKQIRTYFSELDGKQRIDGILVGFTSSTFSYVESQLKLA